MDFNIGFIGFGLIGGSIARGIKEIDTKNLDRKSPFFGKNLCITAYNYHKEKNPSLEAALSDKNIDYISEDLRGDFKKMDLILLCAPVKSNVKYLEELKTIIKPECIISDVGSVKNDIQKAIDAAGLSSFFIGGHPMAGTEHSGYENSSSNILKGAYYILTPSKDTPEHAEVIMSELISCLGCRKIIFEPTEHDFLVALISHLPHLVAAGLVDLARSKDTDNHMKQLAAGGFKDITRVASSSAVMWRDICLSNTESIKAVLKDYINMLKNIEQSLETMNGQEIFDLFARSKKYRDSI